MYSSYYYKNEIYFWLLMQKLCFKYIFILHKWFNIKLFQINLEKSAYRQQQLIIDNIRNMHLLVEHL